MIDRVARRFRAHRQEERVQPWRASNLNSKSRALVVKPCSSSISTSVAWCRITAERGNKPELSDAQQILAEEARRRESIFEQSVNAEKNRGDALARRFEEALRQAHTELVTKPTRDFDLD